MSPLWSGKAPRPDGTQGPQGDLAGARHAVSDEPPQAERLFDADDYMEDAGTGIPAPDADVSDDDIPTPAPARHVRRRRSRRAHSGPSREAVAAGDTEADDGPAPDAAAAVAQPAAARTWPRVVLPAALRNAARVAGAVALIIVVLFASMWTLAVGINAFARWNAKRIAALNAAPASPIEDNLLVIGVSDGVAVGFTALKAERANKRVLGIAIPDGAFMEVPGQGFERVGASYQGGPGVSKDTVTNYLGVPFRRYVVVDGTTYQTMLKSQNVSGLIGKVLATDLSVGQREAFRSYFASVSAKDVWIVPLPVKPVAVGDQQYYEPQRAQVADLLLQWWGVQPSAVRATPRVIVYNGVGTPGLAGVAAQQLIRAGLRVVDSGNADNFKHKETLILVYHGTAADAAAVRAAIGVGRAIVQSETQDLTDMIVIIGADYRPPTADASTVPTGGAQ